MFGTVLVLSAHTDDAELGAGGTIALLVELGADVTYVAFSAPHPHLEQECRLATGILGVKKTIIYDYPRRHMPEKRQDILQVIYELNEEYQPDLVLTPSTKDHHQDHAVLSRESIRIFKECTLLGYELTWNILESTENCVIQLRKRHLDLKLKALEVYKSQLQRQPFKPELVKAQAIRAGCKIGVEYAEVFETIKFVVRAPP